MKRQNVITFASRPDPRQQPESEADKKTRIRRNQHFLRWLKENCCCKRCGARPPPNDLTFHHVTERRAGWPVISQMARRTLTALVTELLKGEFLCRKCHNAEHAGEKRW